MATRGVPRPTVREQIDGVLHDVALGIEIGKDVDRGVGDEKRLRIGRHVHDEDVTDAPRRAQARLSREVTARISSSVCRLPFIRSSPLDLADQLDCLCCGRLTVRRVDELIASDIDPVLLGHSGNFGRRTNQNAER